MRTECYSFIHSDLQTASNRVVLVTQKVRPYKKRAYESIRMVIISSIVQRNLFGARNRDVFFRLKNVKKIDIQGELRNFICL